MKNWYSLIVCIASEIHLEEERSIGSLPQGRCDECEIHLWEMERKYITVVKDCQSKALVEDPQEHYHNKIFNWKLEGFHVHCLIDLI